MPHFENNESFARQLDEKDPLKGFRQQFIIPPFNGHDAIYFLGNSLGLQPSTAGHSVNEIMEQWAEYGVEGFFKGKSPWMDYHSRLTHPLSMITGSLPHEIVVMNQLTVNLHLMMTSFYKPSGSRKKILCEAKAFPSDQYMFETHVKHYGFQPEETIVEVGPREGENFIRTEDIEQAIDRHKEELALVLFSGVNYYSGQLFDMAAIAKKTQEAGIRIGFDLAHAVGNVLLQLHDWNIDFACWCSYKYLNSGPGGIGGVFIHERHHSSEGLPRFAGWWGYEKETRFRMNKGFKAMKGAEGWQLSTPSLVLYALHKASLDIFREAGWDNVYAKGKLLNAWLWFLLNNINEIAPRQLIEFITPTDEGQRGCQVSMLMKRHGRAIFDALTDAGIMVDWREPNVIRLAPVPLYNTFEETWRFAAILKDLIIRLGDV